MFNMKRKISFINSLNLFQSLALTALTLLVSAIGFLNHLLLARVFGIGSDIDAFLYATSIPLFIAGLLTAYFMYGAVPILIKADNQGRSSMEMLIAAFYFAAPFFFIALIIKLNSIHFSLFSFGSMPVSSKLMSIAWIIGGFQVVIGALSAIFNAKKYFFVPVLLQTITPIGFLAGALLTISIPNIVLPLVGMLVGAIVSTILGIIVLWKFLFSIRKSSLNGLIWLLHGNTGLISTLLASSAFAAYPLIDAFLAPRFGVGALSTLGFAQRIIIGFGNIAVIGVFSISGPKFSDALLNGGFDEFQKVVKKSIYTVLGISVPLGLFLWYNSQTLILLIFGDEIDPGQIFSLMALLPIMLVGMIPMLCSSVLLRAALCIKNSRLYIFLFGIGVPVLYFIFCLLLSSIGLLSFGYAYLISWVFGFGVLITFLFLIPATLD
jgi:putative peptidoglycan lipid II flippase